MENSSSGGIQEKKETTITFKNKFELSNNSGVDFKNSDKTKRNLEDRFENSEK